MPPSSLLQEPTVYSSIWKRLCVVNEAELMGEVDQAWLRLGAVEALQVSGCLGLPESKSRVSFISCAFRLHLLMLPRTAPFQLLQNTQQSNPSSGQRFCTLPRSSVIYWNCTWIFHIYNHRTHCLSNVSVSKPLTLIPPPTGNMPACESDFLLSDRSTR